jgi:hypothetical protein
MALFSEILSGEQEEVPIFSTEHDSSSSFFLEILFILSDWQKE